MSASDHIQPKLFHGTAHYFAEGEKVEPSTKESNYLSAMLRMEPNHVYVSSDLEESIGYASKAAQDEGMLFAPVYEVEGEDIHHVPQLINEFEHKQGRSYGSGWKEIYKNTYTSQKPMTPKKIVGWGINPDTQ